MDGRHPMQLRMLYGHMRLMHRYVAVMNTGRCQLRRVKFANPLRCHLRCRRQRFGQVLLLVRVRMLYSMEMLCVNPCFFMHMLFLLVVLLVVVVVVAVKIRNGVLLSSVKVCSPRRRWNRRLLYRNNPTKRRLLGNVSSARRQSTVGSVHFLRTWQFGHCAHFSAPLVQMRRRPR